MLRECKECKKEFEPPTRHRLYCTPQCRKAADRRHTSESKRRRRAKERHGAFYETLKRATPGLPTACESCGEDRLLEVAHKYAWRRHGAHPTLENSAYPLKTNVLCVRCHRHLDFGIETREELGLPD